MSNLAILGHASRGNEVIALLKILGGKDEKGIYHGNYINYAYLITKYNFIDFVIDTSKILRGYKVFTLEDFLKRYPYRVGDRVMVTDCISPYTISDMIWEDDEIKYRINCEDDWLTADELQPYTETDNLINTLKETQKVVRESNENLGKVIEELKQEDMLDVFGTISKVEEKISAINFHYSQFDDKVQLLLGKDFEIIQEDGKTFVVRKQPQYPKTYAECCKVVNASPYVTLVYDIHDGQTYSYDVDNLEHYQNVRKLRICRDAYWKLANNWQPNWKDFSTQKYSISVDKGEIIKSHRVTGSRVLVFPTAEMRDIFYENFKELIESCKELL